MKLKMEVTIATSKKMKNIGQEDSFFNEIKIGLEGQEFRFGIFGCNLGGIIKAVKRIR